MIRQQQRNQFFIGIEVGIVFVQPDPCSVLFRRFTCSLGYRCAQERADGIKQRMLVPGDHGQSQFIFKIQSIAFRLHQENGIPCLRQFFRADDQGRCHLFTVIDDLNAVPEAFGSGNKYQ